MARGSFASRENITMIALLTAGTIIVLQLISIIMERFFGLEGIKLGPLFMVIGISLAILTVFSLITRFSLGASLSKPDAFLLLIVGGLVALIMFGLPSLAPELFSTAPLQIMSLIGIG